MSVTKVIVLYGGISTEHEVSIHSAQTVCRVLASQPEKYQVYPVFINKQGYWFLQSKCGPQQKRDIAVTPVISAGETLRALDGSFTVTADVIFPVLHGSNGEDGTLQGFLETLGIAYVGCGVLASAVGMDKELTKQLASAAGVPIVPYQKISAFRPYDKESLENWVRKVGLPVFVKPVRLGSSVGVSRVTRIEELASAISHALEFDTDVLVEQGIDHAREVFCAVYGWGENIITSSCGELSQQGSAFFDYTAKYITAGGCNMDIPAHIPPEMASAMRRDTEAVFRALQGCGLARADFLLGKDGQYYFSEINTLPGLSETSLWPQLFEAAGQAYPALLDGLIEIAQKVHACKQALRITRI